MRVALTIVVLLAIALIASQVIAASGRKRDVRAYESNDPWARARADSNSAVGRVLLGVAQPLSGTPLVAGLHETRPYEWAHKQVLASGGHYGGSPEVFLATQALCIGVAAAVLAAGLVFAQGGLLLMLTIGALMIAAYPYTKLTDAVRKRTLLVSIDLPAFVDLLTMTLISGIGIVSAMETVSKQHQGPVGAEVRALTSMMRARPGRDLDDFKDCGNRLGTPEARSFFENLGRAHVDGGSVVETLAVAAQALRVKLHHQMRENNKKLPVKLVLIIGMHLFPMLFIVALLPALISLQGLTSS